MDSAQLDAEAKAIAVQYKRELPPDYVGRYSAIAEQGTLETLFRAFSAGLSIKDSCAAAGVSDSSYRRWLAEAEAHPESAYARFVDSLKGVRAAGKLAHLENIQRHSMKEWTASAWTLERTDPEQFALRKDSSDTPKVIVQIGAGVSDVKVGVLIQAGETLSPSLESAHLSPPLTSDLHRLTTDSDGANVNITSLIGTEAEGRKA